MHRPWSVLGVLAVLLSTSLAGSQQPGIPLQVVIPKPYSTRVCTVTLYPKANKLVLEVGDGLTQQCANSFGGPWTIETVACYAEKGTPTVTPVLLGGAADSLVKKPVPCGNDTWAAGEVNGTPVVQSFSGTGATCATPPCALKVAVTSVKGATQSVTLHITGHL